MLLLLLSDTSSSEQRMLYIYIHIQKFWADVSLQICLNCAKWGERDKDGPQVVNNKTFRRQLFPPSAMLDLIAGGGSGFLL